MCKNADGNGSSRGHSASCGQPLPGQSERATRVSNGRSKWPSIAQQLIAGRRRSQANPPSPASPPRADRKTLIAAPLQTPDLRSPRRTPPSHSIEFAAALVAKPARSSRYYARGTRPPLRRSRTRPSVYLRPRVWPSHAAANLTGTCASLWIASANFSYLCDAAAALLTCRASLGPHPGRQNGLPGIFIPAVPGLCHAVDGALRTRDTHQA